MEISKKLFIFIFSILFSFIYVEYCNGNTERINARYSLNGIPYFFIEDIPIDGMLLNNQIGLQLKSKNVSSNKASLTFYSRRMGYAIAIRGNLNVLPNLADPTTYKEVYLIPPHSPLAFFSTILPVGFLNFLSAQYKTLTEKDFSYAYSPAISRSVTFSNVTYGPCDGDAIYLQYNSLETANLDFVMMVLGIIRIGDIFSGTGNNNDLLIQFIKYLLTNPDFMNNLGLKIYAGESMYDMVRYLSDPANPYGLRNMFWLFVQNNPDKVINSVLLTSLFDKKREKDLANFNTILAKNLLVPRALATGLTFIQGSETFSRSNNDLKQSGYVISLSSPSTLQSCLTPFPDIKINDWFREYVGFLASKRIVTGKMDGLFHPADNVTRAEFLKMALMAYFGTSDTFAWERYQPTTKPFSDVDINEWYAPFINFAKQKNLIVGFSDGSFRPNQYITRSEAASIIVKVFNISWGDKTPPPVYTDVVYSTSNPIYIVSSNMSSFAFGNKQRIMNGYKDGSFKPNEYINRAEAAKVVVLSMLLPRR